jgi:hypothetical protein
MTTEPTPRIKVDLGGLRQRRWYGFCVACRRDLFARPGRHYASKGHAERVAAARRRENRNRERS